MHKQKNVNENTKDPSAFDSNDSFCFFYREPSASSQLKSQEITGKGIFHPFPFILSSQLVFILGYLLLFLPHKCTEAFSSFAEALNDELSQRQHKPRRYVKVYVFCLLYAFCSNTMC